jgi:hypothetical protein
MLEIKRSLNKNQMKFFNNFFENLSSSKLIDQLLKECSGLFILIKKISISKRLASYSV